MLRTMGLAATPATAERSASDPVCVTCRSTRWPTSVGCQRLDVGWPQPSQTGHRGLLTLQFIPHGRQNGRCSKPSARISSAQRPTPSSAIAARTVSDKCGSSGLLLPGLGVHRLLPHHPVGHDGRVIALRARDRAARRAAGHLGSGLISVVAHVHGPLRLADDVEALVLDRVIEAPNLRIWLGRCRANSSGTQDSNFRLRSGIALKRWLPQELFSGRERPAPASVSAISGA